MENERRHIAGYSRETRQHTHSMASAFEFAAHLSLQQRICVCSRRHETRALTHSMAGGAAEVHCRRECRLDASPAVNFLVWFGLFRNGSCGSRLGFLRHLQACQPSIIPG